MKSDDFVKAYKFHCHADDHYTQRINFFLIAESMLVISFVTSLTNKSIPIGIGQGISVIGLIFTSIWLYTNARLGQRVNYMIETYLKKDKMYYDYINSAGGVFSKALLTYTLPISMNLLWVFFLCHTFGVAPCHYTFAAFIILVIFSGWMNWYHIPK